MNDIQQLEQVSVQRDDVQDNSDHDSSLGFLNWVVRAGGTISPWWSQARDRDLRKFFMGSDHLSGALYTMVARLTTIPFKIIPIDSTVTRHVQNAAYIERNLYEMTNLGKGWNSGYGSFILDYLTQDNGGFMEVLGKGPKDGPITGLPLGLNHLDSNLVTRTRDPEYPAVYTDLQGKKYKLHYTRVIESSSLPSADIKMNSVGFSGVSRCINTAQHLIDISTFEQEKLGSRPSRSILVGSKISTKDLALAFQVADQQMSNEGLSRFAKSVFIGNPTLDINLDIVDLASLPDGYDKDTSIKLGMAAIALAFGVDLRELWPATITGATKADASIQHMKARGKAIGEILQMTTRQIEQKFLPPYLRMVHDFTDDEEDAARATILNTRSQAYERLVAVEGLTQRTIREKMLEDGSISKVQFQTMELESGRLPDGEPLLTLFYSTDNETQAMLQLPVREPLAVDSQQSSVILPAIEQNIKAVSTIYINTSSDRLKRKAASAQAALYALRALYTDEPHPVNSSIEEDNIDSTVDITTDNEV